MKNFLKKLLPPNKMDAYCYMLAVVAFLPAIYIVIGGRLDYMMLNLFSMICFCCVYIYKFINAIQHKNLKNYFKSASFLLMTLLFAWIFLANFFAYDKNASWLGVVNGIHQEVSVWQYMFYFLVAICAINVKKENINYVLTLFIGVATFVILVQFGLQDYSYAFIHKNHTGYYLTLTLMLAIGKFFFSKNALEGTLMVGSIILHFASLTANGSMGPIIGILAFFVIGLIYLLIHKRQLMVKFLSVLACFLVVTCVCDYVPKVKDLRDESSTTVEKVWDIGAVVLFKMGIIDEQNLAYDDRAPGSDGYGRFMMWQRAIDNMKQFPLFGVGMAWWQFNSDMPNPKPHNEFLQYGAMCGIPALVFYVALMLYLLIKFRKKHKQRSELSFIIFGAILIYLVQSIFGNAMPFVSPLFFLLIGLAIKLVDFEKVDPPEINAQSNEKSLNT